MPDAPAPERVGGQVQSALDEAGGELGLAVLAVVERAHVGRADHDERRVAREALVEGDAVELAPQLAGADGRGEVGPAVDARLEAVDGVHDDEVGEVDAAQRDREGAARDALGEAPASGSIRRCELRESTTCSTGPAPCSGTSTGRAAVPRLAERRRRRPRAGAAVTSGNSTRRRVDLARGRRAGRPRAPARLAERDDRHGPLVHAVGADERR